MSVVRLSICMPTYNFGAFIAETLDSIVPQIVPGVEIVILDGGSTDNTEQVVRPYVEKQLPIRYVRQETRGGIDRDMARSIDLAQGEYCWLFSSDDIMKKGAISRVLKEIESGLDIYVCDLTVCDREMRMILENRISRAKRGSVFDLRETVDRHRYFELAETTPAVFSFMGSLVIRRARWMEQKLEEPYVGSLWAHVVRIFRMIPGGLKIRYLRESLLDKRGDNDSFMEKGLVHRNAITIDGYHRIAREAFGEDSFEARQIRRIIVNEFPPQVFRFARGDCAGRAQLQEISEVDRLAEKTYCDPTPRNTIYLAIYRIVPVSIYMASRGACRAMRRVLHTLGSR